MKVRVFVGGLLFSPDSGSARDHGPVVSRGGSLMFAWMEMTGREKPFYERFDELTKRAWGFLHCALIYSIICVAQVKSIQAQTRGEVALLIPL